MVPDIRFAIDLGVLAVWVVLLHALAVFMLNRIQKTLCESARIAEAAARA